MDNTILLDAERQCWFDSLVLPGNAFMNPSLDYPRRVAGRSSFYSVPSSFRNAVSMRSVLTCLLQFLDFTFITTSLQ
ncbi:hypothetical protein Y032_0184g1006 [Ancylostoma ceylanicum]|nr:hypothetical protein Y032_0184g1006 [Ancylostoma ceylanicum]